MTEHSRAMIQPKEDFKGTEGESKAIAHKYRIARPRSSDRKDSRRMISWRIALGYISSTEINSSDCDLNCNMISQQNTYVCYRALLIKQNDKAERFVVGEIVGNTLRGNQGTIIFALHDSDRPVAPTISGEFFPLVTEESLRRRGTATRADNQGRSQRY